MVPFLEKQNLNKMVQAYMRGLAEEGLEMLADGETELAVEGIYEGLLACVEDELYLQEFLPFGATYRVAGELAVRRRRESVPIEKVMQEHILMRDVFWDFRRARAGREHDFPTEKRVCQCLNNLLEATVRAYQTREPTVDILDPLRDNVTGVFNSLYFMTRLEEEVKRSERYLRDVTVVLLHINSQFEPESAGESELMRAVARVLRRNSRASDILARIENGKFAILVPETRAQDAVFAAERLRMQVMEYLSGLGDLYAEVDIEIGTGSYPEQGDDGEVVFQEAIESLMREEHGS